jgi:hypothetical protein
VFQLALIAAAYYAWRYARGAADGSMAASFTHARDLIDAEGAVGLLFEPGAQSWAIGAGWPADVAGWGYANLHFKGSCLALIATYLWRPASFPFVRNTVIAAMAISLLGYALYPTAPPRFIPELGLDTSVAVTGNGTGIASPGDPWFNPFAAVPSMHVGLATIFAWSLALLARSRVLRAALFAYPLVMTYAVVISGNHFWLDAVFGWIAAAAAAGVAILLGRAHPAWSFRGEPRPAPVAPVEREPAIEPAAA